MRVLGLISGTSHDGIDAAVVEFTRSAGVLRLRVVGTDSIPYAAELRSRLVAALPPAPSTLDELTRLDTLIGHAFAEVAATMAERHGPLDLICSHGQTVFHWVEQGRARGSLQLGQPAWIAERTGIPVVADLRARDIAAGGQGAPLVPLLDELLLADEDEPAAALNLGGIANLTVVRPGRPSVAYDIGPANALIDAVVQDRGLDPRGYDRDGRLAASGSVDVALLQQLSADPYYAEPAPKSTGKEHFHLPYVHQQVGERQLSDVDLIATLTRLTAETVGRELVASGVRRVVAGGGGTANPVLMGWLAERAPGVEIVTTDAFGIPADTKEAIAFALIGWCTWHGLPGNVASATGADGPRVLGALIPGRAPLRLPEPLESPPRLVIDGPSRTADRIQQPEVGLGTLSVAAQRVADTLVSPAIGAAPGETPPAGAAVAFARGAEEGIAVAGSRGSAARPVTLATRWDIASVTKLVTATICLGLVSAGRLDLDAPVDALLPELAGRGITAGSLLRHESGLLPWQPLDRAGIGPDAALASIAGLPTGTPGEHVYSDLGLISLGVLLTRLTGEPLPELLRCWVNEPLGLDLRYGPVGEPVADSAPDDRVEERMVTTGEPYPVQLAGSQPRWRTEPFRGIVHDGNARRALGGISAHAGIFATIGELLKLGLALSDGPSRHALWSPEAYQRLLGEPLGFRTRTLGDGARLHYHPGFTGCALGFVAGEHRAYALTANRLLTAGTPVSTERLWSRVLDEVGGLP